MSVDTNIQKDGTVSGIMATDVPTCSPSSTVRDVLKLLALHSWQSIEFVYVVDRHNKFLGFIETRLLIGRPRHKRVNELDLIQDSPHLHPDQEEEKAVYLGIKDDSKTMPVLDKEHHFLGAVMDNTVIEIMHEEHIEDAMLTAGIRHARGNIIKLATERFYLVIAARAPWLLVGIVIGLGLGLLSSFFEASLEKTVALAYFVPVVAYISNAIGTQSNTIVVRALATMEISRARYLFKELFVGTSLGVMVGLAGGFGAGLIAHSFDIGLVVAISLALAGTVASVLGTFVPMVFKAVGKDPALGAGPLATAFQDMLSLLIYFTVGTLILA